MPGKTLLIDDGKIKMTVDAAGEDWVECVVTNPGTISSRKGVNTPDVILPINAITDKDILDLNFILDFKPDYVALSFVQRPEDMHLLRKLIADHPCKHKPRIIAKIEKPVAIDNIVAIVEASDAIMVARGDLGVEMDIAEVPMIQKLIVAESRKQGKPVIMATQMLESMMVMPSPTRAEASDVATAVMDGVDAVMLSGESAAGMYPRESVEMQRRIITRTENDPMFQQWERTYSLDLDQDLRNDADSVVLAAKGIAANTKAKCIVVFTTKGTTAARLARFHANVPVLAITPSAETARALSLYNHVYPAILSSAWDGSRQRFSVLVDEAVNIAREKGLVKDGTDRLVITGGLPFGVAGLCNIIRVVQAAGGDCWQQAECDL
jgi:pyruvate kinase